MLQARNDAGVGVSGGSPRGIVVIVVRFAVVIVVNVEWFYPIDVLFYSGCLGGKGGRV